MKLSIVAVAVALALGSMSVAAHGKKAPTKAPAKVAKPVQKPGPAKVKIDYKGAKFGTPLEKFKNLVPELPCQVSAVTGGDVCMALTSQFAGVTAGAVIARFYDKKFGQLSAYFDTSDFEAVVAALITKFGKPHATARSVASNRMGEQVEQVEYRWFGTDGTITARRFGDKLTESVVLYMGDFAAPRSAAAANRKATEAAKIK